MSSQFAERLIYEGKPYKIEQGARPLDAVIKAHEKLHPTEPWHDTCWNSACFRGYIGHWEIKNGRLYLNKLEHYPETKIYTEYLTLTDRIFQGRTFPVFADWFSGQMFIQPAFWEGHPPEDDKYCEAGEFCLIRVVRGECAMVMGPKEKE